MPPAGRPIDNFISGRFDAEHQMTAGVGVKCRYLLALTAKGGRETRESRLCSRDWMHSHECGARCGEWEARELAS